MKIAVLCLPGIGDALMATPMVKLLREKFPKAQIDLLCIFEGVSYVYKNNPNINHVYFVSLYKQSKYTILKRLLPFRKKKYDISFLCFPAYRKEYHLVQWFIGAKKRIAHRFTKGYVSEYNFLDTELLSFDENEHHVINNLNLLKAIGINWEKENLNSSNLSYDFTPDGEDLLFGKKYLKELRWKKKDIIGFHPGSTSSPMGLLRRWSENRFIRLGEQLIKKGKKIIIFAGPEELDVAQKIAQKINNTHNCHLVQGISFKKTIGILNNIDLLVTNDNGFGHLANALKIKTILLVGPTNPKWCSPYNKKYCTIIRKAKFTPWFRNDLKADDPVPKWVRSGMDEISVNDVLQSI